MGSVAWESGEEGGDGTGVSETLGMKTVRAMLKLALQVAQIGFVDGGIRPMQYWRWRTRYFVQLRTVVDFALAIGGRGGRGGKW